MKKKYEFQSKKEGDFVAIVIIAILLVVVLGLVFVINARNKTVKQNAMEKTETLMIEEENAIADDSSKQDLNLKETETYTSVPETEPVTQAQIVMSEWGFNNSDDWGNKLVQVVGNPDDFMDQSYAKFNEEYVIIGEGSSFWYFYPESKYFTQGSFYFDCEQISMSSSYVVLDNDTISCPSYGGAFTIDERIVVGDIVIFRRGWEYYIPYEMLDLERIEFYKEDGILDDYKVYLK